jgi:hypothetical protein
VSIARKWTIQCDKCGEEKSSWLWKSEDQLVEDSRKDGWSISDRGEDLCPPCQPAAPSEPPKCRRSETGWCWTHDKMCGEYDASKFCGCGYPKEHSGDCHAPKEKP